MGFWFIMIMLIIPAVFYLIVRAATEDGTYNALIKYDEYKKREMKKDKDNI